MSDAIPEQDILHQDAVEGVIKETLTEEIEGELEDLSTQVAVTNLAAPSGAYVQAEVAALTTRVNVLTQVLRDAGLIPSA